jgi:cytoskeleton protein RodZ
MPPLRSGGGQRWAITGGIVGTLIVLAVAAWWYFGPHRRASSDTAPAPQDAAVVLTSAAVEEEGEARPNEQASAKPLAATTPAVTTPAPVGVHAARAAESEPSGAAARLGLRFQSPSWVEIYDASGVRLMFDERDAESGRTVVGVPPFKVLLGNYGGVQLTLNGRVVQIPQRARYGATARFRVMADGAALSSWGGE